MRRATTCVACWCAEMYEWDSRWKETNVEITWRQREALRVLCDLALLADVDRVGLRRVTVRDGTAWATDSFALAWVDGFPEDWCFEVDADALKQVLMTRRKLGASLTLAGGALKVRHDEALWWSYLYVDVAREPFQLAKLRESAEEGCDTRGSPSRGLRERHLRLFTRLARYAMLGSNEEGVVYFAAHPTQQRAPVRVDAFGAGGPDPIGAVMPVIDRRNDE